MTKRFDDPERQAIWEEWYNARPACIKAMIAEFPLGSSYMIEGKVFYQIGWNEGNMLVLSPINPGEDYEAACEARVHICADHVRKARAAVPND